jgi:hypothetical protein
MGAGTIVGKYVMGPAVATVDTAMRRVPKVADVMCGVLGHDPQPRTSSVNVVEVSPLSGLGERRRAAIDTCTRCRKRRVDTPFLGKVWVR